MTVISAKAKDLKTLGRALKKSLNGQPVEVKNAGHLHGLAAGLKQGEVVIRGDAGDYLGVLNAGAMIKVTGGAGNYLADNMTSGTVVVDGSVGYGAGQYCYGGTIVIHGDAGDFTATMNKGATIIVEGDVGSDAATYMLNGDLIIVGNAGDNFANYLIRGNVFIAGEWKSLGNNTRLDKLSDDDIRKLGEHFQTYNIEASPAAFKKVVAASEKPFYK
jgi:glutamate synthase domain-containing protein 3